MDLGVPLTESPQGMRLSQNPAAPALHLTTSMCKEKRSQHPPAVTRAYGGTCGYTEFPVLVNAGWLSH